MTTETSKPPIKAISSNNYPLYLEDWTSDAEREIGYRLNDSGK